MLRIGVVGCGAMGMGISIVAARGGAETRIYDTEVSRREFGRTQAARFFDRSVALSRIRPEERDACLERMLYDETLEPMADCDLVIEAITEDFVAKAGLLADLNKICCRSTILASNTSTISITRLGAASGRPDRFVGLHFCLPAQLMKLVEVTRGLDTSDEALARAWSICEQIGQRPVLTKDTPGFILNYFVIPLNNDAIRLLERGVAKAADIDRAMKSALRMPLGPLELVDLVGLDTQILLSNSLFAATGEKRAECPYLVHQMVAAGRLGKKAGVGFYDYAGNAIFGA